MPNSGKIIIPSETSVWTHEMATAKVLAKYGYVVRFIKKSEEYKTKTADAYVDGEQWEFKSPEGSRLVSIERCLRRAKNQSGNIIFDSRRMKNMPDAAIVREILAKAPLIKGIKKDKIYRSSWHMC